MTFDDLKAMIKDVAEILKENSDTGSTEEVWVWLERAENAAKGDSKGLFDEIAAAEAHLAPQGIERITTWKILVGEMPLVAIGGIKLEHAADIFAAGADSIAVGAAAMILHARTRLYDARWRNG